MGKLKKEEEKLLIQNSITRLLNKPDIDSWEREFLESIKIHSKTRDLSEKQKMKLKEIKEKYTQK